MGKLQEVDLNKISSEYTTAPVMPKYPLQNDWFFAQVFKDLDLAKELVQSIIGERVYRVESFEPQKEEKFVGGRSPLIRFDVYLTADGRPIKFEIQNSVTKNLVRRARMYSSVLDVNLPWHEKMRIYDLPDSYSVWPIDGQVDDFPAYCDFTMQYWL